jgi:hypothetical protein
MTSAPKAILRPVAKKMAAEKTAVTIHGIDGAFSCSETAIPQMANASSERNGSLCRSSAEMGPIAVMAARRI